MFYSLATTKTSIENSLSIFIAIAPCTLITNTEHSTAQFGANYYSLLDKVTSQFGVESLKNPDRFNMIAKLELCY